MSSSSRDRIEGTLDDAKGRGKMAVGDLTGDQDLKDEGAKDRATGAVKNLGADVKDKVGDLVDKVTGNDKDR